MRCKCLTESTGEDHVTEIVFQNDELDDFFENDISLDSQ